MMIFYYVLTIYCRTRGAYTYVFNIPSLITSLIADYLSVLICAVFHDPFHLFKVWLSRCDISKRKLVLYK